MIGKVLSKAGKEIRLTAERWSHIVESHDYMAGNQDMVFDALEIPDRIITLEKKEFAAIKHYERTSISEKYAVIIYKEEEADGFVITAFMTSKPDKIIKKGAIWRK